MLLALLQKGDAEGQCAIAHIDGRRADQIGIMLKVSLERIDNVRLALGWRRRPCGIVMRLVALPRDEKLMPFNLYREVLLLHAWQVDFQICAVGVSLVPILRLHDACGGTGVAGLPWREEGRLAVTVAQVMVGGREE